MIDERLHAFRPDLCDKALKGQFIANRYVTPTLHFIVASQCPVFGNAALTGGRITTFVLGEAVHCFEQKEGVAWVQSLRDRYVGYIDASLLSSKNDATVPPSHYVHSAGCFIYEDANIKSQALYYAPMTALLNASERIFDKEGQAWAVCKISESQIGYCHAQNLSIIGSWQKEPFKRHNRLLIILIYGGEVAMLVMIVLNSFNKHFGFVGFLCRVIVIYSKNAVDQLKMEIIRQMI